jgi:RNA polymerase sigma-70 factor (ECF subfamily)
MDRIDDRNLIKRYCRGDGSGFEEFYKRHRDGIFRFLCFNTKDEDLAADLTQKVFIRFVEKAKSVFWTEPEHPRRWLYKVALNSWLDERRKQSRRRIDRNTDLANLADERISSEDGLSDAVWSAVDGLPDRFKTVAGLHYFGGLTYEETAKTLGIPVGTVRSRMTRVMELLASKLKDWRSRTGG